MRAYNKILISLILGVIALFTSAPHATAQHNPPKINDELYEIYKRAYAMRKQPQGLLIADTLYAKAAEMKDYTAQALAMGISLYYNFEKNDDKKMLDIVNRIKDFSEKHNIENTYYFACMNYVSYLLNHKHSYMALDYVNNWKKYAYSTNRPTELYYSTLAEANIYLLRHEYANSLDSYKKAHEFSLRVKSPIDFSVSLYCRMAGCCNYLGKYDDALVYAKKGLEIAKNNVSRVRNLFEIAIAYYHKDQRENFLDLYTKDIEPKLDLIRFETHRKNAVIITYYLYIGKYDEAIALAKNIKSDTERYSLLSLIYQRKGDFLNAYKYKKQVFKANTALSNNAIIQGIHDREILNGGYNLLIKNQQLAIQNTEMELRNSKLMLSQAQDTAAANRIKAEHNRLEAKHKQLEAQNIKAAIDNKAIEMAQKEAIEKEAKDTTQIIIIVSCALLALLVIYITHHYKMTKRISASNDKLNRQNSELDEARERSHQSEKMKTMFIQNMSHEIRTPLNAIVGFSQLIANSGKEITKEEKQDFSRRIEDSSELILNIINDILDISAIRSGHYKMAIAPANANEMCRTALFTVKSRVPEGVELRFTTEVDDTYMIDTDSRRVIQVIINFLTNACKNTTEGSIHLHCSTAENDGYLSFIVADTGIGVAPEKMDAIFERFNKLNNLKQGAGLGLNICSSITERLGGLIYIDKNYTHGARFVFAIPVEKKV